MHQHHLILPLPLFLCASIGGAFGFTSPRTLPTSTSVHSPSTLGAPRIIVPAKLDPSNDSIDRDKHEDDQRRKVFGGALSSLPFFFGGKKDKIANAVPSVAVDDTDTAADAKPIADFPMRRLRLPKGGLGREYIIIQLYIQGKGPYDFMVDSGLTTELITPREYFANNILCTLYVVILHFHVCLADLTSLFARFVKYAKPTKDLQKVLELNKSGETKQGLSAGASSTQSLVELNDVSLCCGTFSDGQPSFPIPGKLHAIVTDFPQEQ